VEQEKRELAAELERVRGGGAGNAPTTLGPKPTLENPTGNDADAYDQDKFSEALEKWHDQKRALDDAARQRAEAAQKQNDEWQSRLNSYGKAKASLKVADFDDAESIVLDKFSVVQQGVILKGVRDPKTAAEFIYALGKNPKKLAEISSLTDPVEFAVAVGELKGQMKAISRKAPPPPESRPRGSAPLSGAVDGELQRLQAQAAKTGDYTNVTAYIRNKRRAA